MGSPVSPMEANTYMEEFENKAPNITDHQPRIWKRYVDDTFIIQDSPTQRQILATHKLHRQGHTFHNRRHQTRWCCALLGYHNNTYTRGYTGVYGKPTHIEICIYNGITITILLQNTVSSTHLFIGLKQFVQTELFEKEIQHL